jgi:Photosynthesis system II assembly factor YCF48
MEQLPKIAQQRLSGSPKSGVHPDPDLLAAFAEKSLLDRERSEVLRHLSECSDCRDILALATPPIESAPSPTPQASFWLTWPMLRWGALAACVVVVSAAVTLRYEWRQPKEAQVGTEAPKVPASVIPKTSVPDESREKLAAKIAPSAPFPAARDVESGKLAKKRDEDLVAGTAANQTVASVPRELDRMDQTQELTRDRLARTNANQPAPPAAALVASAPAPVPAPTVKQPGREPQIAESGNKVRSDAADQSIGGMAETVMVDNTRAAPPRTPAAELKAKDEAGKNEAQTEAQVSSARAVGGAVTADRKQGTLSAARASPNYADRLRTAHVAPRWTLSGDGVLQRSFDSGKTWQTIPVANNVVFLALAANDSDIWAGGAAGALYHSSDAGQHWVQVTPTTDGNSLTGDIITVEFRDAAHGKVTTSTRETWTTADAGHTWQKY